MDHTAGTLALSGGGEWQPGADYDADLLESSGVKEVLILPTAAAYEHPERAVATAERWFSSLGAQARGLMVLRHADANDESNAAVVREAGFIYLSGGSPLHLLSVLKGSAVFEALAERLAFGSGRRRLFGRGDGAGRSRWSTRVEGPSRSGSASSSRWPSFPITTRASSNHFWRTLELAPEGIAGRRHSRSRRPLSATPTARGGRLAGNPVAVYVDGVEAGLDALPR